MRFESEVQSEREALLTQKKQAIIQRQKDEIRLLIQSQVWLGAPDTEKIRVPKGFL